MPACSKAGSAVYGAATVERDEFARKSYGSW